MNGQHQEMGRIQLDLVHYKENKEKSELVDHFYNQHYFISLFIKIMRVNDKVALLFALKNLNGEVDNCGTAVMPPSLGRYVQRHINRFGIIISPDQTKGNPTLEACTREVISFLGNDSEKSADNSLQNEETIWGHACHFGRHMNDAGSLKVRYQI